LKTVTLDPYGVTSRNSLIDAYELNVEGVKRGSVEILRAAQLRPEGSHCEMALGFASSGS